MGNLLLRRMRRHLGVGPLEEVLGSRPTVDPPIGDEELCGRAYGVFRLECAPDLWVFETGIGICTELEYELVKYDDIQNVGAGGPKSERPSSFFVMLHSGRKITIVGDCGDDPKVSYAYSWISFLARVCSDIQGRVVVAVLPPEK